MSILKNIFHQSDEPIDEDKKGKKAKSASKDQKPAAKKEVAKEGAQKKADATKAVAPVDHSDVLVRPVVTEKAALVGTQNQYVFVVRPGVNKFMVAEAIEKTYKVKPIAVNVMNVSGKKRTRRRIVGQEPRWRKAIVTLPKGKSITLVEGV